ncbi:DNA/RNA helicase domain-containing protein [Amycolatopsis aidingensis]|uniref:DNA/RNA helicase domain-containing protein n=1 Tax=Amycolatopsis aidingensis TaxID=2842453 RepID=UPI0038CC1AE8
MFLLDEDQAVRPGQIGTRDYIETAAHTCGATVRTVQLDSQHRSRSPRYDAWVRRLLGLDAGPVPPAPWNVEEGFELQVADSPASWSRCCARRPSWGKRADNDRVLLAVERRDSRTSVGRRHRDRRLAPPVECERQPRGQRAAALPLWAIEPAGADQVGCIYTAQGFEYDHGGVILSPDLLWRGDRWVTDTAATRDNALTRTAAADFDRWVRRTYRVLLTGDERAPSCTPPTPKPAPCCTNSSPRSRKARRGHGFRHPSSSPSGAVR